MESNALQSKYGLAVVDINNSNCYYTRTFNGGASSGSFEQGVDNAAPSNNPTANHDGLTDFSSGAERIPLAPTDKSPIGTRRDGDPLRWSGVSIAEPGS